MIFFIFIACEEVFCEDKVIEAVDGENVTEDALSHVMSEGAGFTGDGQDDVGVNAQVIIDHAVVEFEGPKHPCRIRIFLTGIYDYSRTYRSFYCDLYGKSR